MYTARAVTNVLGLSAARLRSYVRAGFVKPERGDRGELRFSFRDLVVIRRAEGLVGDEVSPRRVRETLRRLHTRTTDSSPDAQGESAAPLAGLSLRAEGGHIIVEDGDSSWRADDGQVLLDFDRPRAPAARHGATIAPLALARAQVGRVPAPVAGNFSAQELYDRGCALEDKDPAGARDLYRKAIELDPDHADSHVNLGRLLHEAGHPEAAQIHYRLALASRPQDSTAAFNLGVALEDLLRKDEAVAAYERAIAVDPGNADAHYNLARLLEQSGRPEIAIRHLIMYRQLTKKR